MDLVEDGVKEPATFRYLVHILLRCLAFRSATGHHFKLQSCSTCFISAVWPC